MTAQTAGQWTYTVTGLTTGTGYWFAVRAVDGDQLVSPLSAGFKPDASGSIGGTVNLENATDHAGVSVSVDGTSITAVSASNGAFTLTPLPAGSYTIRFTISGFAVDSLEAVEVISGQTTALASAIVLKDFPEAPTGVAATYQNTTTAMVTWSASSSGDVVGYDVYYGSAADQIDVKATVTPVVSQTGGQWTYTVTGLVAGGDYWFAVLAIDGDGLASVLADPAAHPERIGEITGTVALEGQGDHAGVTVSVDGTSITAVSASDGSFTLTPISEGSAYTLQFVKTGFESTSLTDVAVVAGQVTALAGPIAVLAPPVAPTGVGAVYLSNTSVQVTWSASVSGDVAGYDVYYGTASDQIDTQATGSLVTAQTAGQWTYTVTGLTTGTGYWFAVRAVDGDQLVSPLSAGFKPDASGSIGGTVNLENETDHAGVSISVDGTSITAVSASNGAFTLTPLSAGSYTIRFAMNGFAVDSLAAVEVISGQTTVLASAIVLKDFPEAPTGVAATYQNTTTAMVTWSASSSGDVVGYDVYYGSAADQIDVKATVTPVVSQTGGQWTYTVTGLVAGGDYWFAVLAIDGDGLASVLADPAAHPERIGEITGTVQLAGLTEYAGVTVSVDDTSVTAVSSVTGAFILSPLPPGTYTVRFTKAGFVDAALSNVQVISGNTTAISSPVVLDAVVIYGEIEGILQLEGGATPENVTVSLDGTSLSAQSAASGYFILSDVPAGTYDLTAYKAGYFSAKLTGISVTAGVKTSLFASSILLTKAPEPPTNVTAQQASGSSATVSWTASVSTDVAGYSVYYGTNSAALDQQANSELIDMQVEGSWQHTVTGLEKGVTYFFGAQAVDNDDLTSAIVPTDGSAKITLVPSFAATVQTGGYQFNLASDIVLNNAGTKGYVSSLYNACLLTIDFSAGTPNISSQINLPGSSRSPQAMAVNPARETLYVVDNQSSPGALFLLDLSNDTFDTTPVTVGSFPQNVIVSADGSKVYVCANNDTVTVIDGSTHEVVATIPLGEDADPFGMTIADNKLYVVSTYGSYKVFAIDLDSQSGTYHTVIASIPVGTGAYQAQARFDGAYVYVSHNTADGKISIIDTATNTTLAQSITIKEEGEVTNKNPKGMAVNGDLLYVVNWGDSTVTMINTSSNTKLALSESLLSAGNSPVDLVVTANGENLYIVHSPVGGSVEILSY